MKNASTHKITPLLFFCLLFCSFNSPAQWVRKVDGIIPRSELVSVEYKGKIYSFFGFRDSLLTVVEPSAEVYDPATNTWKKLASIPSGKAVTHTGVAVIDDMVWHVGGRVGKHPGPLTPEIWIYHINTNTWSQGPNLTDPATGKALPWAAGGAAFLGRTLHVFGGLINSACNGDQSNYHLTLDVDEWLANPSQPAKWKNVLAPMPVKRNHLSAVVLGGKIYAIGGQFGHDCGGGQDQRYAHVYNPATNTWTQLPQMSAPHSHSEGSSFVIDGKIYLVGGQASGPNSNKVTIFDPAGNNGTGTWRDDTNLTLPNYYETLSAKVIGSTFVISHGGQPRYNNPRKTTYTRTITRNPVYQFGFLPACSNLTMKPGSVTKRNTLLFTIDGSKDYVLSSNASWLTVTKNGTGTAIQNAVDIEATINTAGLAPGTYTGTITVTGTGSGPAYAVATYCVNLTVNSSSNYLEAEEAVLYRAVVDNKHAGYTGTGFADYINTADDYIAWTVNRPSSGEVVLQFRYANGATADRPLKVVVNGAVLNSSLSFPPTGGWANWSTVSVRANLNGGSNNIRLTAIGKSGPNLDHLAVMSPNLLEAEEAVLYRAVVDNKHAGYTGTGFADYINSSSDFIEWTLNNANAGPATLQFRYANGSSADRPLKVEVNGAVVSTSLSFPPTGAWTQWSTISLTANLNAGTNKIRITAIGYSGGNIDHLLVWPGTTVKTSVASLQVLSSTTLSEVVSGFSISVAPNPASGVTKLRWSNVSEEPVEIRITDASGMIRRSFVVRNSSSGQFDLMLSGLPDGLYVIYARQGKAQASTKLLLKKND